jgi:ribose transport system substrate-binding protein
MSKLFRATAALLAVIAIAACLGAVPAQAAAKQMAFVMPNATHGFMAAAIQYASEGLKRDGAKYPDIETRLLTSADPSEQSNQLDTLINEKVDTIVLWPHNGDDLRSAAQKVIDAGIKLVVFDRLISDIQPVSEVDMDNFAYGAYCAQALNDFFKDRLDGGEKIQVLEFKGDNSTAATVRTDGFNATKHANIEIVQSFSTDWQRSRGLEYMETFLTNTRKEDIEAIDAIFSHDGEPTGGAFDAMVNYNGSATLSNLKVIAEVISNMDSVKLSADMKDKFGIYHAGCFVPPSCTDFGVAVGFDVANGKEVPKAVKIGYVSITTDNYTDFLADEAKLYQLDVKY